MAHKRGGREGLEWEDKQFGRETDLSLRICLFWWNMDSEMQNMNTRTVILHCAGFDRTSFLPFFHYRHKSVCTSHKTNPFTSKRSYHSKMFTPSPAVHPQKVPEVDQICRARPFGFGDLALCKEFTNGDTRTLCSHLHTHTSAFCHYWFNTWVVAIVLLCLVSVHVTVGFV